MKRKPGAARLASPTSRTPRTGPPRGGKSGAAGALRGRRLRREGELPARLVVVADDRLAVADLPFQDLPPEHVLHLLREGTLQRPRPVRGVVAHAHQVRLGPVG